MLIVSCHANFHINLLHIDKVGFGQDLGAGMWLGKAKSSIPIFCIAFCMRHESHPSGAENGLNDHFWWSTIEV